MINYPNYVMVCFILLGVINNHALQIFDNYMEVLLTTSKTDQYGSGMTVNITAQSCKNLCPTLAIKRYLRHFCGNPLTSYHFSAVLKRALQVLGVPNSNRSSHSFRIGMATECAMQGLSDEHIQRLGRWKSSVFLRYIRIPQ